MSEAVWPQKGLVRSGMPRGNLRSKGVRRDPPSGVALQTKGTGDRLPQKSVAKRREYQPQGAFGNMMFLVADPELSDEAADGVQDGIERIAIPGQNHPGSERSRTLAIEGIERAVDDFADVPFAGACALHRLGDAAGDAMGDGQSELGLETGGRSEMVKQVGVGPADLRGDRLQRHGLWALVEQQLTRSFQRGGSALFGVQAFTAY